MRIFPRGVGYLLILASLSVVVLPARASRTFSFAQGVWAASAIFEVTARTWW